MCSKGPINTIFRLRLWNGKAVYPDAAIRWTHPQDEQNSEVGHSAS